MRNSSMPSPLRCRVANLLQELARLCTQQRALRQGLLGTGPGPTQAGRVPKRLRAASGRGRLRPFWSAAAAAWRGLRGVAACTAPSNRRLTHSKNASRSAATMAGLLSRENTLSLWSCGSNSEATFVSPVQIH